MAKKITKEEYKNQLESKINKAEQKNEKPIIENKNVLGIISLILNIILVITIIIVIIVCDNHEKNMKNDYDDKLYNTRTDLHLCEIDLEDITKKNTVDYTKEKLDFYDKNIVFVINDGNYYYTYDCVMKKFANKKATYRAYNSYFAKSEGFKKGKC